VDELLVERGFDVDHLLIWWVQRFTPLLIEAARPCGMAREGQIVTIETDDPTLRVYAHRDPLIKAIPAPAARKSAATRPTITPPTAKPARHCHPSTENDPSPGIWNQTHAELDRTSSVGWDRQNQTRTRDEQ
jgi:hypothetical protein